MSYTYRERPFTNTFNDWRGFNNTMADYKHFQMGGLAPLLTEALPDVSSSSALFIHAPVGTVGITLDIRGQNLAILWNKPNGSLSSASVSPGGGIQYVAANGPYDFPVARDVALAARAVQMGASCTGTITYWGLVS